MCNIGTGRETSVNTLFRRDGPPGRSRSEPEFKPLRAGELDRNCLDPTRAGIQLGWSSWTELGEGTLATIEFVRNRLQESGEI